MITAIMFGIFLIFLGVGVPIAASVGWATLSVNLLDPSFACDAIYFVKTMANGMDSYVLLAVPLFMLSSSIMAESGLSGRLFNVFSYFFGNLPAGLPIAVVITCLFYGAICGSGPATVAAIGTMCIPLLTKLGYDKDFVTSMIAVAGGLGVIIPPSIPFITYGLCTGASIGDLFIAGFMPGLLIGLFIVFYVIYYFARHDNSNLCIEAYTQELRSKGFLRILKEGFWALLAPVIILGGIYGGIVSPTEAAGVSVVYALLIGVVAYREINFKKFIKCLVDTGHTATPVMLILGICIVFGRVLSMLRNPQTLATFVTSKHRKQDCGSPCHQPVPAGCRYADGYDSLHSDPCADLPANRSGLQCRYRPLRYPYDLQPCNRICDSADWHQPFCGAVSYQDPHYAHCKARSAVPGHVPRCTFGDHVRAERLPLVAERPVQIAGFHP